MEAFHEFRWISLPQEKLPSVLVNGLQYKKNILHFIMILVQEKLILDLVVYLVFLTDMFTFFVLKAASNIHRASGAESLRQVFL